MKDDVCSWMSEDQSEIDQNSFICMKGRYFYMLVSFSNIFLLLGEDIILSFIKPTFDSWHSFLRWKYEDGYLVNLGLDQSLSFNEHTNIVNMKNKNESVRWMLDYNGKTLRNQWEKSP